MNGAELIQLNAIQVDMNMIQIMKGNSIDYLQEFFTISSNQTYQLRSNNHVLYLPKPNTNALKRSFRDGPLFFWRGGWKILKKIVCKHKKVQINCLHT